jgi:hypothetical protein
MHPGIPANRERGTLQPERPAEGSIKCEVCGCRWVPSEECFGCPGCETSAAIDEIFHTHDPA